MIGQSLIDAFLPSRRLPNVQDPLALRDNVDTALCRCVEVIALSGKGMPFCAN
jgi:hypothetical protein